MTKYIVLLIFIFSSIQSQAQCLDQLNRHRDQLDFIKEKCVKSDLSDRYVMNLRPGFYKWIAQCEQDTKKCVEVCNAFENNTSSCTSLMTEATQAENGMLGAANTLIAVGNKSLACLAAEISKCADSAQSARTCASANEGIYQANDTCSVDMTNLSVSLQKQNCEASPAELQQYQSQKNTLLDEINTSASQMESWGRAVLKRIDLMRDSCTQSHELAVIKKRQAEMQVHKTLKETQKFKKSISN